MTPRHLLVCWDPLREKITSKSSFFLSLGPKRKNHRCLPSPSNLSQGESSVHPICSSSKESWNNQFLGFFRLISSDWGQRKKTLPVLGAAILQQGFQVLGIRICFLRFFQVPLMFLTGGTIRFKRGRVERLVAFWWITAGVLSRWKFLIQNSLLHSDRSKLCKHSRFSFGAGVVVLRWALVRCLMAVLAVVLRTVRKQLPRRMDPNHCYAHSCWVFFPLPTVDGRNPTNHLVCIKPCK